jgi:hypothetical protein
VEGGLDAGVAIGLLIPLCCDRGGARWPGERFEVICLRSIVSAETEANVNGRFRKKKRTAYKDPSSSTSLLLKLLKDTRWLLTYFLN